MLLDKNEEVRIKLDKYIRKFGIKKIFIARKLGLKGGTTVGLFLNGQRKLSSVLLDAIEDLMEERM